MLLRAGHRPRPASFQETGGPAHPPVAPASTRQADESENGSRIRSPQRRKNHATNLAAADSGLRSTRHLGPHVGREGTPPSASAQGEAASIGNRLDQPCFRPEFPMHACDGLNTSNECPVHFAIDCQSLAGTPFDNRGTFGASSQHLFSSESASGSALPKPGPTLAARQSEQVIVPNPIPVCPQIGRSVFGCDHTNR